MTVKHLLLQLQQLWEHYTLHHHFVGFDNKMFLQLLSTEKMFAMSLRLYLSKVLRQRDRIALINITSCSSLTFAVKVIGPPTHEVVLPEWKQ
jgi:hypothetical protein